MNRRILALLLAALLCAAAFAGCAKKPQNAATPAATSAEAAGGKEIGNANAKTLTIERKGNDTVVTISFVLGSKIAGVDEAAANGVPKYRVYSLGSPDRVVLEFAALEYWDYDRALTVPDDSLFYAVFKKLRSGDDRFNVFFQLKEHAAFKVKEDKDKLVITFTRAQTDPAEKYYVVAQNPQLFNEGALPEGAGLSPTLCSDLENTALISKAFATQSEAEGYKSSLVASYGTVLSADMLQIVPLAGNALPEYSESSSNAAQGREIMRKSGEEKALPVVMPDGVFLCSSPDGKLSLFSKQLSDASSSDASDTIIEVEELWLLDSTGKFKRLSEIEFATIEQAQFSPDGKKLAILERTTDTSFLYIFDMETNSLQNLGEEGFGEMTSEFVWDSLGTAIYAITGSDKQQLLKYDFTIPDETARVSAVEEKEAAEGDLGFSNGDLYFANVDADENSQIFKIKPEGGLRSPFAKGSSFRISPDGKYMAILESRSTVEEETNENTTLKIMDMSTGKETIVLKDAYIVSYEWDPSGALYFEQGFDNSENDAFPYRLMRYSLQSSQTEELCDLVTSDFSPTTVPGRFFIPYIASSETQTVRATYLLDLNAK